jgi:hypothetical protein
MTLRFFCFSFISKYYGFVVSRTPDALGWVSVRISEKQNLLSIWTTITKRLQGHWISVRWSKISTFHDLLMTIWWHFSKTVLKFKTSLAFRVGWWDFTSFSTLHSCCFADKQKTVVVISSRDLLAKWELSTFDHHSHRHHQLPTHQSGNYYWDIRDKSRILMMKMPQ